MGSMTSRIHKEFTDDDLTKIASTYHAWRGEKKDGDYHYVAGYSKAASLYVSRWLDRCPAESERINLNHTISCRP